MTITRVPTYKLLVDWFNHGGLDLDPEDWSERYVHSTEQSTEQTLFGTTSYKVTWDPDAPDTPRLFRYIKGVTGNAFTVSTWLYVPTNSDDLDLRLFVQDVQVDSETVTTKDAWVRVDLESAATPYQVEVRITPNGDGVQTGALTFGSATYGFGTGVFGAGSVFYVADIQLSTAHDDITEFVASSRTVPDVAYGRDSARDLDLVRAGQLSFELLNNKPGYEGRFTPGNAASPLGSVVAPGRVVRYSCTYNNLEYVLFVGKIEELTVNAREKGVNITANDQLTNWTEDIIHTTILESCRVGDAIHAVLDAAGFEGPRDIDPGATTIRWFGRGGVSVKTALDELMAIEGPPAIYHMDEHGGFVFRDRNHRLVRPRSTTSQATLSSVKNSGGTNKWFLKDSDIDYGFGSLINVVDTTASIARPASEYSDVWSTEETIVLAVGESKTLEGSVDGGFIRAQDPEGVEVVVVNNYGPDATDVVTGEPEEDVEYDYLVLAGSVQVTVQSRQGTRASILIENTGASVAKVKGMKLRARAILHEDISKEYTSEESIAFHGSRKTESLEASTACEPDVEAVANKWLRTRGFRRPTFELELVNYNDDLMTEILSRNFGDRLTLDTTANDWAFDGDAFVEAISHHPDSLGKNHRAVYSCEAEPSTTYANAFKFGSATYTFGTGVYQSADLVTAANVFRLDQSTLGGTDKLAY